MTHFVPTAFVKMGGHMRREVSTNFGVALLIDSGLSRRGTGERSHVIQFRSACCMAALGRLGLMRPLACDNCEREVADSFVTPNLLNATHFLNDGKFEFNRGYAEACEAMASASPLDPILRTLTIAAFEDALGRMLHAHEQDPQAITHGALPLLGVME